MQLDRNLAFSANVAAFGRSLLEAFPNLVVGRYANQKVGLTAPVRWSLICA